MTLIDANQRSFLDESGIEDLPAPIILDSTALHRGCLFKDLFHIFMPDLLNLLAQFKHFSLIDYGSSAL